MGSKHTIIKTKIPTGNILGVKIAAINMNWLLDFTRNHISELSGNYMCAVNVYSNVTAYDDPEYAKVLNEAILCMADGGPLSTIGRKQGFKEMQCTAGPSYMDEIFKISRKMGYKHFFMGVRKKL